MATQASTPLFLEPGTGQTFHNPDETHTVKVRSRQTSGAYAMGEALIAPHAATPLHAHGREDQFFYVLEGELDFQLASQTFIAGSGSTIYVRRGTAHRFENRLGTPTRLLAYVLPGGFENFLDQRSQLPPDHQASAEHMRPLAARHSLELVDPSRVIDKPNPGLWRPPGNGPVWKVIGERITPKIRTHESGDLFCLFEEVTPPFSGPPVHIHLREDELFYIVDGDYEFRCGDQRFAAQPGSVVLIPHGMPHGFANVLSRPGKMLIATIPGGLDLFFEAVDHLDQDDRPDPLDLTRLAADHGVQFVTTMPVS